MTEWQAHEIRANGIRLHYYRTGGDKRPLVLAHGLSDDALCWRRVVGELAPCYDLVFYDMRGHGRSEAPATGYGPEDRGADLVGLVEALGLGRVKLMGHSLGAETVSWVAAHHAALVERIVLEDPPWRKDWAGAGLDGSKAMEESWRTSLAEYQSHTREELVAICRGRSPGWAQEDVLGWAEGKLAVNLRAVASVSAPRPPWQAIVRRIPCPTLLITAEPERGALVTPEVADEAVRVNPKIEVFHVAGAGHSVRRDRFAEYVQGVSAFLAGEAKAYKTALDSAESSLRGT